MQTIGTIRKFKTKHFTVIVDALPEDSPVDVNDDGETAAKVDNGDYVHFIARARVLYDGCEVACDYLGGCIYESLDAFMDHKECAAYQRELRTERGTEAICIGSYFADMIRAVCAEARKKLSSRPYIRQGA